MTTTLSQGVNACNLCFRKIERDYERFLVEGQGQFNVHFELKMLDFDVIHTSRYICRGCVQKLKKTQGNLNST